MGKTRRISQSKIAKRELTVFRLTRLMMTLLGVPRERFNMDAWAGFLDESGEYNSMEKPACQPNLTCGAAACALGWEASQPYAIKAGLHLEIKNPQWDTIATPVFGEHQGFGAGEKYFGITNQEAAYLFDPEEYDQYDGDELNGKNIQPHHVCGHIAHLIRFYNGLADAPTRNYEDDDE